MGLSERHKKAIANARRGQQYGPNYLRYDRVCLWCGCAFPAARPEAQTCKAAHRVALNRYVKKHGKPPLFPFGVKPDTKRNAAK